MYCHFSGTKGHFISFASSRRVLKSSGSKAEKVKEQVKILQRVQPQHLQQSTYPAKSIPPLPFRPSPSCYQLLALATSLIRREGELACHPLPLAALALQVNGNYQPLKRLLAGSLAGWWLAGREELLQDRQEETCFPIRGEDFWQSKQGQQRRRPVPLAQGLLVTGAEPA